VWCLGTVDLHTGEAIWRWRNRSSTHEAHAVFAEKVTVVAAPLVPWTAETRQRYSADRPRDHSTLRPRYRGRPIGRWCSRPGWLLSAVACSPACAWDPGSRRHGCDARVCLTNTSSSFGRRAWCFRIISWNFRCRHLKLLSLNLPIMKFNNCKFTFAEINK